VHLADILTRALLIGSGGDAKIPPIAEPAWQALGLAEADFPKLFSEFSSELQKAGPSWS